jgi:pimeloyl-ACP methyl ester carboxylesterase
VTRDAGVRAGLYCEWALPPGRRPVLVLLPGLGGSVRHWWPLLGRLPGSTAVIAVDPPGHGSSPGALSSTVDSAVDRIDACVAAITGDAELAVIGHSAGGLVALAWALSEPTRITHLGLLATAARITPHPLLVAGLRRGELDEAFVRGAFPDNEGGEPARTVVEDLRRVRLAPDTTDLMGVGGLDLSPRLGEIRARTLVVVARGDPVVSPRRSRALAAGIAGARLVVVDGGHYLNLERPDLVAAAVRTLLGGTTIHCGGLG